MLKGVLLPHHGIWNWQHVQGQLGVCPCNEQVEMRPTEHLTNRLEHPGKKGPFRAKDVVGATQLVRKNVLLARNAPGQQIH